MNKGAVYLIRIFKESGTPFPTAQNKIYRTAGICNSTLKPEKKSQMKISSVHVNKCCSSEKGSQSKPIMTTLIISHSHVPELILKRYPKVLDTKAKTDHGDASSFYYITSPIQHYKSHYVLST